MKRKAPSTKHQIPEKLQAPIFKSEAARLELGYWSFTGAWVLVLGVL